MATAISTTRMTAEDMAAALGTSVSHIYASIAKYHPQHVEKRGKTSYYNKDFLDMLKTVPRRRRQRRVVQQGNIQQVAPQVQPPQHTLIERIGELEEQIKIMKTENERFSKMEEQLTKIAQILGA